MKKRTDFCEESISVVGRGRVLARILAEDLRLVQGDVGSPIQIDARTDPPPGFDVTFRGSDEI